MNKNTLYVGNASVSATAASYSSAYTAYLFAVNNANSATLQSAMQVYSTDIYDNGTPIRKYVPHVTALGTPGLLDALNNVFYASVSATDFTAGPEIVTEWTLLEYVKSNGQQWVNTMFRSSQNTRVCCDFEFTGQTSGLNNVFGAWDSGKNAQIFLWDRANSLAYGYYGATYKSLSMGMSGRNIVDCNRISVLLNGNAIFTFTEETFSTAQPLYLFAFNNSGTAGNITSMILYSCKIYDVESIVYDLKPCRLIDDRVGLVDESTGIFFESASATPLIAGPAIEIVEPVLERKVTVDLIPPMSGVKREDFSVVYSVYDDIETESFEVVEYIDGEETASHTVAVNEQVLVQIQSTAMEDGIHTFMVVVDGIVEVEYTFVVDNTTLQIDTLGIVMDLPKTVNVNEKFLVSVVVNELSFTIAKLKIHSGDIYAGEV